MNVKKHLKRLLAAAMCLVMLTAVAAGCGKNGGEASQNESNASQSGTTAADRNSAPTAEQKAAVTKTVVTKMNKNSDGSMYVDYMGDPMLVYGIQIRPDDILKDSGRFGEQAQALIKEHFQKTKEAGFDVIYFPLALGTIYDGEKYDFTKLATYYSYAEEYDVKIMLQWQGINVCGYCPSAKWMSESEYPLGDNGYLDLSNEKLAKLEYDVLTELMYWFAVNDTKRLLVGISVGAEPDGDAGGRTTTWCGGQFEEMVKIMDSAAKAIKDSPYSVFIWCNLTIGGRDEIVQGYTYQQRIAKIIEAGYVDCAGMDAYYMNSGAFDTLFPVMADVEGNFPLTPETSGSAAMTLSATLRSFENQGGLLAYELRTFGRDYDLGVYRKNLTEWEERDGTGEAAIREKSFPELSMSDLKNMNECFRSIHSEIATAKKGNIVSYNYKMDKLCKETKKVGDLSITFECDGTAAGYGGLGMALKGSDGAYYFFATRDNTVVTVKNAAVKSITTGKITDGRWADDSSVGTSASFTAKGGVVYRIAV